MNLDKAIINGVIVTHLGRFEGSIGIKNGKIASITNSETKLKAKSIIDVNGKFVVPGAIDSHVHFQPLKPETETIDCATAACAVGGITTGIGMPSRRLIDLEGYKLDVEAFEGESYIDYALNGRATQQNSDEIVQLWKDTGITAVKMYMTYHTRVDDGVMWEILEKLQKHDGLSIIHAENDSLIKFFRNRLKAEGRKDPMAHNESRPEVVEIEAIRRLIYLVEQTKGKAIVAHVSTARGLEEIKKAQQRGVNIWAESCPHYFTFVREDTEKQGPFLVFTPVMRGEDNRLKMWELLEKGYIETIGSDHGAYELHEKEAGLNDIWKSPFGIPGLEVFLPSLLDGVSKGLASLERIVAVTSYNTARIYGLYPKKGTFEPGADADIVVLDMDLEKTFTKEDLKSNCPYSPYIGRTFKGWPVITMVRGEIVAKNGDILGEKGYGKLISRNKQEK